MIYFITGGERSGKSRYAQQLALTFSNNPTYIATARKWDADFDIRIARHQDDRDERWQTIEEEIFIDKVLPEGGVAVIDCVTLWLTNFFVDNKSNADAALAEAKEVLDRLRQTTAVAIIISNEIGMGVHASHESGRKFVELQGWINQYIASFADHVVFMVSGIPLTIKHPEHV
jgi:adenosylcobinamide kinase / adenosylcobinamide-phosphate guanylyltransferase